MSWKLLDEPVRKDTNYTWWKEFLWYRWQIWTNININQNIIVKTDLLLDFHHIKGWNRFLSLSWARYWKPLSYFSNKKHSYLDPILLQKYFILWNTKEDRTSSTQVTANLTNVSKVEKSFDFQETQPRNQKVYIINDVNWNILKSQKNNFVSDFIRFYNQWCLGGTLSSGQQIFDAFITVFFIKN